jgi:LmbE family N-acetylglucosaminyl deacetylase
MATLLGVWAHPDDEAYLSAGLMATARERGDRVVVATATRGEIGGDVRLRESELATSLAAVGVHEHQWLGFADGTCERSDGGGVRRIEALIEEVGPDTIVTFGPDGITGHPDHRAVSAWTTAAWAATGYEAELLYATLTPEFHIRFGAICDALGVWMEDERPFTRPDDLALTIRCRGRMLDRKMAALRAHASQTEEMITATGARTYRQMWATEWFAAADRQEAHV